MNIENNTIIPELSQLAEWKATTLSVACALSDERQRPDLVKELVKMAKSMAEREAALFSDL